MASRRQNIIKQAYERIDRIRASLSEIDYLSSGTLLERMKSAVTQIVGATGIPMGVTVRTINGTA